MTRWFRVHFIREIERLLQSKGMRPITNIFALLFLLPGAALAQGSPFDTGFTAIQSQMNMVSRAGKLSLPLANESSRQSDLSSNATEILYAEAV